MDKEKLLHFLLKARTETYVGDKGEIEPALKGSKQLEHSESDWFYRDVYNMGKGLFMGIETVYFQDEPVWSMSYYGDYKKMTENEADEILRDALIENWETARLWKRVEWQKGEFKYTCEPDFGDSLEEAAGQEKIFRGDEQVYNFFYAGGMIK